MSALGAGDFRAFYEQIHEEGWTPFPWQERIVDEVLSDDWPGVIDVPTGLGKTCLVDIATFALAAALETGGEQAARAPTRLFFVVDRRVIVDAAYEHARHLADALGDQSTGVVGRVADALRLRTGGSGPPLDVVRMRGGVTWGWRWLERPDQPAIVVSTVDQFGSRLLFRGYGVGRRLRPIDAALCGTDGLVLLDEAHLAQPLVATLRRLRSYEAGARTPLLEDRPLRIVTMSATPGQGEDGKTFGVDLDHERGHRIAAPRIDAKKHASLVELGWVDKPAGRRAPKQRRLAEALARLAAERATDEGVERLGVVVNTVPVARSVFEELRKRGHDAVLLIGRSRGVERQLLTDRHLPGLRSGHPRGDREHPLIAVATQTIEVGADLDFDALVTEAAPLDSLVQRFGRVARGGDPRVSRSVVVFAGGLHEDDVLYGQATAATWRWLSELAGGASTAERLSLVTEALDGAATVDFGIAAMRARLPEGALAALVPEPPTAPVVLPAMLDAWARSEPQPLPDQPVAPFLHGVERGAPQVTVFWRADLPRSIEGRTVTTGWSAALDVAPPRSAELVEVPLWEARRFLADVESSDLADVEAGPSDEPDDTAWFPVLAAVYEGKEGCRPIRRPRDVQAGDMIVVASVSRGHDEVSTIGGHDEFGWTGSLEGQVPDVGDLVSVLDEGARGRIRLRLDPHVLRSLVGGLSEELVDRLSQLRSVLGELEVGDPVEDGAVEEVLDELDRNAQASESLYAPVLGKLVSRVRRASAAVAWSVHDPTKREVAEVVRANGQPMLRIDAVDQVTEREIDDSDEAASSYTGQQVALDQHLDAVGRRAAEYARNLGFDEAAVRAAELAGRLHDLGKADVRFQAMLRGGDRFAAEAAVVPLAKSGFDPGDRATFAAARAAAGWPKGMRHEAISGAVVDELDRAGFFDDEVDVDLVRYLVSTHHGWGRPLSKPVSDPKPEPVEVHVDGFAEPVKLMSDQGIVDWGQPARFWRLCHRYGWWGLASLEAVVRLADIGCSEEGT